MSTIVLRATKGSPLTNTEVDLNFDNLNTDKLQLGGTYAAGTANGVAYLNGSKQLTTGSALVFDGAKLWVSSTGEQLKLTSSGDFTTTGTGYIRWYDSGGAKGYIGYAGTASQFDLQTGAGINLNFNAVGGTATFAVSNAEQMRLNSTGLGIGTSSPAYKLDVAGTVNVVNGSNGRINIGATNNYLYGDSTGNFIVGTSGSDKLQLNSAGNLGLGVTPSAWGTAYNFKALQISSSTAVFGDINTSGLITNVYYDSSFNPKYIKNNFSLGYLQGGSIGTHQWLTAPSGTAGNAITFTQVMTLDASGNLLVGKTSSSANGDGAQLFPSGTLGLGHTSGTVTGTAYAAFGYAGGGIGSITQSGTTAVLYNVTSDYRLKTVIGPVANAGQRIDALQPVEYKWKTDGSRTQGFLAHQFQEVYAGSVNGTKDAVDAEGKPVYQSMQASSSEVIADLVAEIQSLRKRLAALESK